MRVSAPGKFILFGEHAVVYGEPAVAVAVDLRLKLTFTPGPIPSLNGDPDEAARNRYAAYAFSKSGRHGDLRVDSDIPSSVGLGSSAAFCCGLAGTLWHLHDAKEIAKRAFALEVGAQRRGSPIDTSTSAHGSAVMVATQAGKDHLWTLSRGDVTWHIHHVDVPEMSFVVGDTGVTRHTQDIVAQVAVQVTADPAAKQVIKAIGDVAHKGVEALRGGDVRRVGRLMDQNQLLLRRIGVSTPELEALIEAVKPHAVGAKLTGAGGGGSIVALTEDPDGCAAAIKAAGGTPYLVRTTTKGAGPL